MLGAAILWIGLGSVGAGDYLRPLGAKAFDQATLDAEGFGDKKGADARGRRPARDAQAGRARGRLEDAAGAPDRRRLHDLGHAVRPQAAQARARKTAPRSAWPSPPRTSTSPTATLLREIEPDGKEVYRPIDNGAAAAPGPQMMMNRRMIYPFGGNPMPAKPAKPDAAHLPRRGQAIRLEFRREGQTLRYQVFDDLSSQPREIGQFNLGPGDIAGVKLFASNRNGAEPVDVLFRDLTIHADRISGLGTAVRTVFGTVVHGDPTATRKATSWSSAARRPRRRSPLPPRIRQSPRRRRQPRRNRVSPSLLLLRPLLPPTAPATPAAPAAPPRRPRRRAHAPEHRAGAGLRESAGQRGPAAAAAQGPHPARRGREHRLRAVGCALGPLPRPAQRRHDRAARRRRARTAKDEKKPAPATTCRPRRPGRPRRSSSPKVEPKPNGIRDLHLALSGLREVAIQQVMIQCQTDKGQATWQLDTTGSPDWPLTLRRAGIESWADLFLEPPAGDCHDKEFTINVTYADGQTANAKVKATDHTDPKLAFDPEAPAPPLDARVYLAGDEQLFGKLEAITEEALTLTTPWGDRLDVPDGPRRRRLHGDARPQGDRPSRSPSGSSRRGSEDLLLARAKDGEVVAIAGVVEGAKANKLTFVYQGKARTLPLKQVEGLSWRPGPSRSRRPRSGPPSRWPAGSSSRAAGPRSRRPSGRSRPPGARP